MSLPADSYISEDHIPVR